jgi:hypothetical protein
MSPRVQANKHQKRRRAPRIPKISSRFILFFKALTEMIFIFDQGFFIAHLSRLVFLFRSVVPKVTTFKIIFPLNNICFQASVSSPVFFYDLTHCT